MIHFERRSYPIFEYEIVKKFTLGVEVIITFLILFNLALKIFNSVLSGTSLIIIFLILVSILYFWLKYIDYVVEDKLISGLEKNKSDREFRIYM